MTNPEWEIPTTIIVGNSYYYLYLGKGHALPSTVRPRQAKQSAHYSLVQRRANLFVHKDRSCYQAMLNLASALSVADYEMAEDGIYLPHNVYAQWQDSKKPKQDGHWIDDELREMYRPGSNASERLRRSHLLRDVE